MHGELPLVSIIILCCNALRFTRACLDSVLRFTRKPYELIVVDNGSTDGTPGFLEDVKKQLGPGRVQVICNPINRGYAAGGNQALAEARGQFLVFLHNDALVSANWLEGLLKPILADKDIGLVGAVSNYVKGRQCVECHLANQEEVTSFAAQRQRDFAGHGIQVRSLSRLCLLVRREVFEKVGAWDERFGLGYYEDDDLCLRADKAGFRMAITQEVYVHHFGSQTFDALGLDTRGQLTKNAALFREKWGIKEFKPKPDAATSEPKQAGQNISLTQSAARVSLCMIVKNEENNLSALSRSLLGICCRSCPRSYCRRYRFDRSHRGNRDGIRGTTG